MYGMYFYFYHTTSVRRLLFADRRGSGKLRATARPFLLSPVRNRATTHNHNVPLPSPQLKEHSSPHFSKAWIILIEGNEILAASSSPHFAVVLLITFQSILDLLFPSFFTKKMHLCNNFLCTRSKEQRATVSIFFRVS
jgi:hypothetical protein